MTPAEITQKRDEAIADVIAFLLSDDDADPARRDDDQPNRTQHDAQAQQGDRA
jgi:hypothetical protein